MTKKPNKNLIKALKKYKAVSLDYIAGADGDAKLIDSNLHGSDPRFRYNAVVVEDEGCVVFRKWAFLAMARNGKWLYMFAEHHRPEVWGVDEVEFYAHGPKNGSAAVLVTAGSPKNLWVKEKRPNGKS